VSAPRQLPLPLPHRPALGREDFLVAPCNADAVAWLDRWPDWPSAGLVVYGPPGCGKSHLGAVWAAQAGARDLLLDEPACAGDEEALLHRLNFAREQGGSVLLLAREPPARWPLGLADLRSRLLALPAVAVGAPDDALLAAVLAKLFADRQAAVGGDVLSYLVARMERSFAAAGRLAEALDRAALAAKRPITPALARRVLDELHDKET
jgi:chromosomal replication initiation ATPase DnaA